MICPRCQTLVSDDAAICDNCDAILDTAFLGGDITNEGDAEPNEQNRTRVRSAEAPKEAPPPPARRASAPPPDDDAGEAPSAPQRSAFTRIAAPPPSVTEAAYDLTETFKSFGLGERLAAGGAMVFLLSLGLPWLWTVADEDTIGLFAGAWFLGLFAAIVCVSTFVRRRAALRPYSEWIYTGFISSAAVMLAGTVIFLLHSTEKVTVSMGGKAPREEWRMMPGIGLYLGLIAAVVAFFGAVVAYRERHRIAT